MEELKKNLKNDIRLRIWKNLLKSDKLKTEFNYNQIVENMKT